MSGKSRHFLNVMCHFKKCEFKYEKNNLSVHLINWLNVLTHQKMYLTFHLSVHHSLPGFMLAKYLYMYVLLSMSK